jgi:hypothetical protein
MALDYPPTEFGPQIDAQAWSLGSPLTDYRERHSWWHVVGVGAMIPAALTN